MQISQVCNTKYQLGVKCHYKLEGIQKLELFYMWNTSVK